MIGRYAYPCTVEVDSNGFFVTRFPDIPEAINGAERLTDLNHRAADALITALNFCIEMGESLPVPSLADENQATVTVPAIVAAKLALYETLCEGCIGKAGLANRLDRPESYVDRLLDLHNRCYMEEVDQALAALGRRVVVSVQVAD
ncbi:hypothetical protein [Fodinicurvata sp. EGI_FJ10296]|jgi:antitoxin HicB|uniref:type II toxin-antitoxin system HicB family antitoxin n=1 Tax=Fodinicurvata sp. EGI_FJ10296 TaxID=3231908 RepID=UPI003451AA47